MSDPMNPYAKLHLSPAGPGDQRRTALQIVEDMQLKDKLADKVIMITGGTSGIGIETAQALYSTGAQIYLMIRNKHRAKAIITKKGAQQFLGMSQQLNVVINNAGILACPYTITSDGFERQLAVNYLSHFAMTTMLLPTLIASSSVAFKSRGGNDPFLAYGQSKTAVTWSANHLDRLYRARGVRALSLNPGGVMSGLQQYATEEQHETWKNDKVMLTLMKSPEQGAATTVWAAVAPVWEDKGGFYLSDCKAARLASNMTSAVDDGYTPHCYDPVGEEHLWILSLAMAKVTAP
ncbi:hypothetical protein JX266_011725 [Neoarthrinium moseri]|uniref:uncharacterized protein n=1 Tax=Neoarthrinium moseri TaxID=1658444 RepID=UPI001FDB20F7|nr:uncharacterized protein JN550_002916 [Neoarthrinium moseri]KAI1842074.1 hypothetical protein JX266_011725 [Neoarthrinium moseri]KAI1874337.1 hypothetical protein JN550_002916 [Neoarthrinium moseri]